MIRRCVTLLLLLLALPAYAQQLNPGGGIIQQSGPTTPVFPPGPVSIIGNSGNGSDQITGIANLNGVRYADQFPGADIGAKCNAAIASLGSQGGRVHIPAGHYTFSTTIQCPTGVQAPPIIIEGDAREGEASTAPLGTWLSYTGSGDAVNQFINNPAAQNGKGCELRDLTLDGSGATGSPIGFHVGGTNYSRTQDVTIENFAGAGIELENGAGNTTVGMFTERYDFSGTTSVYNNGVGIKFICDPAVSGVSAGCDPSFGHGNIDIWTNTNQNQVAIQVNGYSTPYNSDWKINGNIGGTNNGTIIQTLGNANVLLTSFTQNCECQATTQCTRFNIATGTVFGAIYNEGQEGGPFVNVGNGALYVDTGRNYLGFLGHLTFWNPVQPPALPAVSACGTSPSVNSNSVDSWGFVTIGTGTVTSCTITFANNPVPWKRNPFCIAQSPNNLGVNLAAPANLTTMTILSSGNMAGNNVVWVCGGLGGP